MNPYLGGVARSTYKIDLDIIKSPSSASIRASSPSSSPSSTISETSNSPTNISTRKPRTARKRQNQKYNEAAALLSTACPNIFSTKDLLKPCEFSKVKTEFSVLEEAEASSELLLIPFPSFDEKPVFPFEPRIVSSHHEQLDCVKLCDEYDEKGDDLDAESMLDEEIEEGIDSIMGNMIAIDGTDDCNGINECFGYPFMGLRFDLGFGSGNRRKSAFRRVDSEGEWCGFPIVNVGEISPRFEPKQPCSNKKKKKKKVEDIIKAVESNADSNSDSKAVEDSALKGLNSPPQLLLKLNYDEVLKAWSDRESPFSDENPAMEGMDTAARLAQIDLFGENGGLGAGIGGVREASVLRYKEKRRTRLFSKKIRYQVRKVNADQRPRMKGRFVRTPDQLGASNDKKRSKAKAKNIS
ncbi:hypothetical protein Drorol1_Dr00006725 [Drosera rotundifolia]